MSSSQQQDKLKQLGNDLVQKQEYESAAKFYDRALELDSTSESSAAIFSNRSLCYLNTKKYSEALQDAEKAISLRPTWHRGYQRAAAACEKLANKNEEGLKHLEKCFELDEASKTDSALKVLKETFEINIIKQKAPSMSQDELKQIGNTLIKNQQYESAIVIYTLAIEKDAFCDAAVPILSNRSMAYFKIGKFKEAYEDGGFCCGIKPDWPKGFMRRGVAAEKLEEWQIALESYDEYLKLDPQDDAGVTTSRKAVVAVLARKKREAEQERLEREELKRELEGIKEPHQQFARCIHELLNGANTTFDIERMKMAMSQPCKPRLDTPLLSKYVTGAADTRGIRLDLALEQKNLELAKKAFAANPKTTEVTVVAELALSCLGAPQMRVRIPMARQVQYLDFLLDLVEEQGFAVSEGMTFAMSNICRYDCTSSDPRFTSIRKDLVITLFDRIEASTKFFLGKSATSKDFATAMLSVMCAVHDPRVRSREKEAYLQFIADHSKDICTQDTYECICTAMANGASPNTIIWDLNNLTPLGGAIMNLRSLRVVELMLRHGAKVNLEATAKQLPVDRSSNLAPRASPSSATSIETPLAMALRTHRPDLVRALVSCGAKLPTQKTPDAILKLFPPSKYPLVKPQYAQTLEGVLSSLPEPSFYSVLTHEYLQTLFEIISNQGLSFVIPSSITDDGIRAPLTLGIGLKMNLEILETMIKLKPDFLQQMVIPPHAMKTMSYGLTPFGSLIHDAAISRLPVPYLVSVAKLLMKYGVDPKMDIVQRGLAFGNTTGDTGEALLDKMIKGSPGDTASLKELRAIIPDEKRK